MSRQGSAPAFLFDVDAWLTSARVAMMTADQERGYLRLLLYQWKDPECRLPNDDSTLSVLSKMGEAWFNGGSDVVKRCFRIDGDFLVNDRLLQERVRWNKWQEKSRKGGQASAEARKNQALNNGANGGSTTLEPKGKHENGNYNTKKKESKSHSADAASDPRSAHPAIQAMRKVLSRYPPKETWDGLIERIGESPNLPKLKAAYAEWVFRGFNKTNLSWIDWAFDGIPPRNERGSGKLSVVEDTPWAKAI